MMFNQEHCSFKKQSSPMAVTYYFIVLFLVLCLSATHLSHSLSTVIFNSITFTGKVLLDLSQQHTLQLLSSFG